jgi:hypothetical protein
LLLLAVEAVAVLVQVAVEQVGSVLEQVNLSVLVHLM